MATTQISNSDDVIDSRDVIARIEELEGDRDSAKEAAEEKIASGEMNPQPEVDAKPFMMWSHDGKREFYYSDYFGADEEEELHNLLELQSDAEGYSDDWSYGSTLIRDSYFQDYAHELVSDIGDLPKNIPNYLVIDWEATASNIQQDYTSVEFDGVTYWVR